jgi:hypothetical protein
VYSISEHLITPYSGAEPFLRRMLHLFIIAAFAHIEMTLGTMVTKWGILKEWLSIWLKNSPLLFGAFGAKIKKVLMVTTFL